MSVTGGSQRTDLGGAARLTDGDGDSSGEEGQVLACAVAAQGDLTTPMVAVQVEEPRAAVLNVTREAVTHWLSPEGAASGPRGRSQPAAG